MRGFIGGPRLGWVLVCLLSWCAGTWAFDDAELDVFDLVEEVNANFYEFMGVSPEVSPSELRKAYRNLSLKLHPDKNPAEDAETQFRFLVAIYEVLKDAVKREIYDRVLVEGLPDWRMPIYYYRRMRKMGLAEGVAYLLIIVTICQYFVNWAAYWERKFTLQEQLNVYSKRLAKKAGKKGGNGQIPEEVAANLAREEMDLLGPKPTCYDTLPFQSYRGLKALALALPGLPGAVIAAYQARQAEQRQALQDREAEIEERAQREADKKERKERNKRRKRVDQFQDRTPDRPRKISTPGQEDGPPSVDAFQQPANALQIWTDQDLARLARLIKKYPPGTPDRWEKIAEIIERLPWEVTKMSKNLKDIGFQVPISKASQGVTGLEGEKLVADNVMEYNNLNGADEDESESSATEEEDEDEEYGVYQCVSIDDYQPVEIKTKAKTKGGKLGQPHLTNNNDTSAVACTEEWAQDSQKALEAALIKFPKGTVERWDRIASKVPGKSKEECMLRFKHLAELVKKRRQEQNQEEGSSNPTAEE
ncbi:hypothetical protein TCAL_02118 [Tigriopus californicus]|uniref:DnaJ homolog subfamily C member 1 n=1 Tax=Tigriopus californicus TaxID=6832 RepID=A0A553N9T8_TIGCA|nr:dnaJ homolog subfamily C member 1-like [Tigriopus californicus]TRY62200.1 hypothetical protein TCAL_02118 [Tigriopus californicus]